MQYLLTQEEFDNRSEEAKKEFEVKKRQMLEWTQKVLIWVQKREREMGWIGRNTNLVEELFRDVGNPPE